MGVSIITPLKEMPVRKRMWWIGIVAVALATAWSAAGKTEKTHDWPAYSADKASTKYSPLDQINKDTVGKL